MRTIQVCFFLLLSTALIIPAYSQPRILPKNIPHNIPSEVREKIELLYSSNAAVRADAAYSLGEMKQKAIPAIPFLIDIMSDDTPLEQLKWEAGRFSPISTPTRLHSIAARALVKIGTPTVEALIAALNTEDKNIRWGAAFALKEIKDKRAIRPLILLLDDKDWDVRIAATHALWEIGKSAVEPLIGALGNASALVRKNAAQALGMINEKSAVQPLINGLKDENPDVRKEVVRALGRIEASEALQPLIIVLKDRNTEVRKAVAEVLGKFRDPNAIEPLISALKDEDWHVSWQASLSLEKITGKDFGKDPLKWREWWETR